MHEAEATTEWGRGRGHIIWPRGRADLEALTSVVDSRVRLTFSDSEEADGRRLRAPEISRVL